MREGLGFLALCVGAVLAGATAPSPWFEIIEGGALLLILIGVRLLMGGER